MPHSCELSFCPSHGGRRKIWSGLPFEGGWIFCWWSQQEAAVAAVAAVAVAVAVAHWEKGRRRTLVSDSGGGGEKNSWF